MKHTNTAGAISSAPPQTRHPTVLQRRLPTQTDGGGCTTSPPNPQQNSFKSLASPILYLLSVWVAFIFYLCCSSAFHLHLGLHWHACILCADLPDLCCHVSIIGVAAWPAQLGAAHQLVAQQPAAPAAAAAA
jgi:hypothetical protein